MATAQKELHNQVANMGERAKDMANEAANRAKDVASEAANRAKDFGSNVAQKAGEASSFIGTKAEEATSFIGKKADDATSAVGAGMKTVAGAIREKTAEKGVIGATGSAVADTLEQGGRYLQEQGLAGIGNDMSNLIRRNPIPALLVGIGLGYLVARAITPRS